MSEHRNLASPKFIMQGIFGTRIFVCFWRSRFGVRNPTLITNGYYFIFRIDEKLVLTPMGKKMSAFPLDPKYTKAIICAQELGCT